ncbi:response regulator [Marinobacterium nitratireducens]|uniref:Response regulator n=1 Tax=Marinobacterium nitratireducens TaxID=518897 RepID=A0A917Z539_9GAMM|nr:response regulator [Marinobacterium nitratireducens]GGO75583.1 response regulator [Marinobacterium nitratireducens]
MKLDSLLVLVVEPSRVQRHIIADALRGLGVRHIEPFDSGTAALERMRRETPDIVLSSMHLPDMTGTELVTTMRRESSLADITFLLVSSETHYRYLEPVRQAGAIAILPKPFDRDELRTALQSTLLYLNDSDAEPPEIDDFEHLRVLLVDDSGMSRRYLAQLLQNLGIRCLHQAGDGAEALRIMRTETFDLVVTDYNMPHINGEELVTHIRHHSEQPSVPVLMVTSEQDSSRLAAIQAAGVSAICSKPFGYDNAKQLIQQLVLDRDL